MVRFLHQKVNLGSRMKVELNRDETEGQEFHQKRVEKQRTSGYDGGIGKHNSLPRTTTGKITTKLQSNYHPELSKNQATLQSDKQRIKEVIFIQKVRKSRDAKIVPHQCVMGENRGGYLEARDPRPTPGAPAQDSGDRKISPHNFWL